MSDTKIETVRSSSSGVIGRAQSVARGQRLVLDSSARPQPDALTNSEAFLAGISSCGVTLIEQHAQEKGVPLKRLEVTIEGVRSAAAPNRFESISMHFTIAGVDQTSAERLVETYRER
jgi:uncharacterized OsmC-like protein